MNPFPRLAVSLPLVFAAAVLVRGGTVLFDASQPAPPPETQVVVNQAITGGTHEKFESLRALVE